MFSRKKSSKPETASQNGEKRREQRLPCDGQILFVYGSMHTSSKGRLIDISSSAAAFISPVNINPPNVGETILVRFKLPCLNSEKSDFVCRSYACRIDNISNSFRRIAIRFAKSLPYTPTEKCATKSKNTPNFKAAALQ